MHIKNGENSSNFGGHLKQTNKQTNSNRYLRHYEGGTTEVICF